MIDIVHHISPDYFLAMCDDTGIFQHAVFDVADRAHGYCVDDNARALLATYGMPQGAGAEQAEMLRHRFTAFIQHAWNPDVARFRNFMGFDRRWLEPQGSDDSHGRTLWALGVCSRDDPVESRREWAARLLRLSYPAMTTFRSPRAWAFAILGLSAYGDASPDDRAAAKMCDRLTAQLADLLEREAREDWIWFEDVLAYDNARLPQALLTAGQARQKQAHIDAGLRSLRWLISLQTGSSGLFRPVGSDSFGLPHSPPEPFDQQPVEVAATVAACRTAHAITGDTDFSVEAQRAFAWLLGENDLGIALLHPATGRCRDGLHPDRANENCGGESVVSALLAAADLRIIEAVTVKRIAASP